MAKQNGVRRGDQAGQDIPDVLNDDRKAEQAIKEVKRRSRHC